jgi:glycosyltransferase involved in cell wall biosynthesis
MRADAAATNSPTVGGKVGAVAKGRALVVQYGARRQYAVPAALARAGALERLYTDACAGRGLLGRVAALLDYGPAPPSVKRLAARRPPPDVLSKTSTFETWRREIARTAQISAPLERARALQTAHRRAGSAMVTAGFGTASHVLVMFMEASGLLTAARARGLVTLTDVNIAPSTEGIVVAEQRKYPSWERPVSYWGETLRNVDPSFRPMEETLTQSDKFLCPSEFVRDDLVNNFGIPPTRTRLVPYGVNPRWLLVKTSPEPGRILFAGTADLRKGVHVLAEASRILWGRGRKYRFRIAGAATAAVRERNETKAFEFVGRLPYVQMYEEFARADVVTLPSIAEGSAGVTYEALGCGIPQVVTRSAGSVARDGVEGLIVPERDPEALACAIEAVVEDRSRRDAMAQAARVRAEEHSWAAFERRLVSAIFE